MNLDQRLKLVNTSKPQLVHTESKQSITASDDYYSLESDQSNEEAARRYQTPPSHMRSPKASREMLRSEATMPTIQSVEQAAQPTVPQRPPEVHFGETHTAKRKPVSSKGIISQRAETAPQSPPTPGVDDTPYIRFAIDQLTRDEEVVGPRQSETADQLSQPPERIIRNKAPNSTAHESRSSDHERQSCDTVIRHPNPRPSDNVFIPIEPADGFRYPELDFVPGSLRIASLSILVFCCLLMIIGLVFSNVWSLRHNGLWQYDGLVTSRYFVFQFLPQILASIIVIWLLVIQCAMHRVFPFTALASGWSSRSSDILHNVALFPTTFLIPNLAFFRHAEPLLGVCSIIFWLALFTVPLQACLFQTRYYALDEENVWMWTSVQPIGWILSVLYLLVIVALVFLLVRFSGRLTGLKWDAASLADIMVLIQRSNILDAFERAADFRSSQEYRLGYWRTSTQPNDHFHCIGEADARVNRYSSEHDIRKAKRNNEKHHDPAKTDLEAQRAISTDSYRPAFKHQADRYRFIPWYLKETYIVAWLVTAIVLLIAFIAVSFVHHAVENGFLPLLPVPTTSYGFSPADFLYSFLPSLIGMILFLLFQPLDLTFRALQPFANLASTRGATAEQSLLLDYTAQPPILITINALLARHLKVTWLSFMSLASITLPILGGGVFTAQFFVATQDVRIAAHMPAYDALIFFVTLYALSFIFIWPGRKRHLPHDFRTLGQITAFVSRSRMLQDRAFREPQSRIDLVTRLLGERRYGFGVGEGVDGGKHLGIDFLERGVGKERMGQDEPV